MKEFITNSYAYFWVRFLRCMLTNVAKKITPDKFLYLGYRTPNMTYSRTPNSFDCFVSYSNENNSYLCSFI